MEDSSSSDHQMLKKQALTAAAAAAASVHEILGGGSIADVILWRKKNVTMVIVVGDVAVWLVFERFGYTLLSLFSSVLLLLASLLFFWAKSAEILNRPAPPLPELHLSEETMNRAATSIRIHINALLTVSRDIALGRNPKLYIKVAASLFMISVIGSLTDFFSLVYISVAIVFTVPAIYERHEDWICTSAMTVYRKLQELNVKFSLEFVGKAHQWMLEKNKLS